ncbi:DUF1289 domain-containing protein [Pseudohalocynthiibacter aestuariivivens]|nr:DUF1289 domain-containing protein [Pseudohalocynthiibacter aestuariivivens]QIE47441.1 DUF1289 domain-containing protein [Pseudohalocynthiibacter aestuariivivens]
MSNNTEAAKIWSRDEVKSPCIRICVVHPEARICTGCNRTTDEISRWSRMTDDERARINAELPGRTALLRKRRGGRAARLAARDE